MQYDGADRLEEIFNGQLGSADDHTINFAYSNLGQITSRTSDNARLDYSALANVTIESMVNMLNELSSIEYDNGGATTPVYDDNGNLESWHDGATTHTYDYDDLNQLTGAGGATLKYDALGRLRQIEPSAGATRRYLYDGNEVIGEYNASKIGIYHCADMVKTLGAGCLPGKTEAFYLRSSLYDKQRKVLSAGGRTHS